MIPEFRPGMSSGVVFRPRKPPQWAFSSRDVYVNGDRVGILYGVDEPSGFKFYARADNTEGQYVRLEDAREGIARIYAAKLKERAMTTAPADETKTVHVEVAFRTKHQLVDEQAQQAWLTFDRFSASAIGGPRTYEVAAARVVPADATLDHVLADAVAKITSIVGDALVASYVKLSAEEA
jgi:hypothetical protein